MAEKIQFKRPSAWFFLGLIAFLINPIFVLIALIIFSQRKKILLNIASQTAKINGALAFLPVVRTEAKIPDQPAGGKLNRPLRLDRRKKYLQIALNSTLADAAAIIAVRPPSERIILEIGTPLLKIYGVQAVRQIRIQAPDAYLVADNKCADLAEREAEMLAAAGANATTVLGVAPIETIDRFIFACEKNRLDAMVDMMNVADPLAVLKRLKKAPAVVILHRGVDETEFSQEKTLPYYQIKQIKGNFKTLIAIAGGDTIKEVQQAIFNDADIAVIWKSVYKASDQTAALIRAFLRGIK